MVRSERSNQTVSIQPMGIGEEDLQAERTLDAGLGHKLPAAKVVSILPAEVSRENAHSIAPNGLRLPDQLVQYLRSVATARRRGLAEGVICLGAKGGGIRYSGRRATVHQCFQSSS